MDPMLITALGTAAMLLSTVSLLPQVIRTWRTRSANDISTTWLVVALLSMILWISYGTFVEAPAIVWANIATFVQVGFILTIKMMSSHASSN